MRWSKTLNIGKEFSDHPIGRYRSDGEASGEVFRDDFLIPRLISLEEGEGLTVVLDDGVDGYGSSFLVEAFGGVVKKGIMKNRELLDRLRFSYKNSDFSFFEERIRKYIEDAAFGSERGNN